jgi:hypothetical protein
MRAFVCSGRQIGINEGRIIVGESRMVVLNPMPSAACAAWRRRARAAYEDLEGPGRKGEIPERRNPGITLSPVRRRAEVALAQQVLEASEGLTCRAIGQSRTSQRYIAEGSDQGQSLWNVELRGSLQGRIVV